jgi:hypothetical protein
MKTQTITPDPNCEFCQGEGMVYDSVTYGSANWGMPSFCECVENQANEEDDIVLKPYEPDPPYDHTGHDTLEEKHL